MHPFFMPFALPLPREKHIDIQIYIVEIGWNVDSIDIA